MRRRLWTLLAIALALGLVAAACGNDDDATDTSTEATTEEEPAAEEEATEEPAAEEEATEEPAAEEEATEEPAAEEEEEAAVVREAGADLVIWADDTRTPALRPFAEQFAAENGINVVVQELTPFEDIDDRVTVAGPAGEGPDIFVGAHDQLGGLVTSGVIAPVDLGAKAELYAESAIQAMAVDGQNYGLPYSIENIALIRNTDLVPDAPATFEDLETTALQLVADGQAEIPLAIQQNPGDPFHNYPLYSAFGGYVFGQNDDGSYDASDVGLDSDGALAAADAFAAWADTGLITPTLDFDQMLSSFGNGEAPFAITGPWAIPDFEGVNFVVEPIPPIQGGETQPFVGVQGLYVSAFAENPLLAQTFLVDFMATEEAALALFEADPRPPAMLSALEQVSSDPNIEGFGAAGVNGQPMPNIPEMNSVWTAWTDAYQLIFEGSNAQEAFQNAADQVRNLIESGS